MRLPCSEKMTPSVMSVVHERRDRSSALWSLVAFVISAVAITERRHALASGSGRQKGPRGACVMNQR